jgi:alpha-galactosidase
MKDAGYEYVVIDDCWQAETRDSEGNLQADPVRFPSGIENLAQYVHQRGLKLGIYTSVGAVSCAGYPGSLGYEAQDAWTFARWGVDFVKNDFCTHRVVVPGVFRWGFGTPFWDYQSRYRLFSKALQEAGAHYQKSILFSLCNWGFDEVWKWGPEMAQMWRTYWDIFPHFWWIKRIVSQQRGKEKYAGPGGWNDPDMLEVGVGALSPVQARSHFSLWAMLAAPLIAGNDIRKTSHEMLQILLAPEVIEVNQDPLGIQGQVLQTSSDGTEVWMKPLTGDQTYAVALYNPTAKNRFITVHWKDLLQTDPERPAQVRDLWKRENLGSFNHQFTSRVEGQGVVLLKVSLGRSNKQSEQGHRSEGELGLQSGA